MIAELGIFVPADLPQAENARHVFRALLCTSVMDRRTGPPVLCFLTLLLLPKCVLLVEALEAVLALSNEVCAQTRAFCQPRKPFYDQLLDCRGGRPRFQDLGRQQ